MKTISTSQIQVHAGERAKAAIIAALIGGALLFLVGFAPSATVHNAAHDARHTLSFPCH